MRVQVLPCSPHWEDIKGWICTVCGVDTKNIHWMEDDSWLCDDCLEDMLSESEENEDGIPL